MKLDIGVESDWYKHVFCCDAFRAGLNIDVFGQRNRVNEGLILELLIWFKNYSSVAWLQNYFVSQGKVCSFSGEYSTPGATVVAMAVC